MRASSTCCGRFSPVKIGSEMVIDALAGLAGVAERKAISTVDLGEDSALVPRH
jgi:hypothetical protein